MVHNKKWNQNNKKKIPIIVLYDMCYVEQVCSNESINWVVNCYVWKLWNEEIFEIDQGIHRKVERKAKQYFVILESSSISAKFYQILELAKLFFQL